MLQNPLQNLIIFYKNATQTHEVPQKKKNAAEIYQIPKVLQKPMRCYKKVTETYEILQNLYENV